MRLRYGSLLTICVGLPIFMVIGGIYADTRTWTQKGTGRTLVGQVIRVDNESATIELASGRIVEIPLKMLVLEDLEYIKKWNKGEQKDKTVDIKQFTGIPKTWTHNQIKRYKWNKYKVSPTDEKPFKVDVRMVVPGDFDIEKEDNWIVVINSTVNGELESASAMNQYWKTVVQSNAMCIAVDAHGGADVRKNWNGPGERAFLVMMILEELERQWPVIKKWNYVPMGFSGGGGNSMWLAAALLNSGYKVGGVWNGGSCYTDSHIKPYLNIKKAFYKIPLFSSIGRNDRICREEHKNSIYNWAEREMRHFRGEMYDGEHDPYMPHVTEALSWFKKLN